MRVVDLGNGCFEERKVTLDAFQYPWLHAAQRHLEWLAAHLAR